MKIEYVNPFIHSIHELFQTMLSGEVRRGTVGLASKGTISGGITALIGISGFTQGTVALSLPDSTAFAMVSRFLNARLQKTDKMIQDGIAEFVNIIAGSAKAKFTQAKFPCNLSLPIIVKGNNYKVHHPSGSIWLDIPFISTLGSFNLRLTFRK